MPDVTQTFQIDSSPVSSKRQPGQIASFVFTCMHVILAISDQLLFYYLFFHKMSAQLSTI